MNIALLMNKKDWTAIFMACICLILMLLIALIGRVTIWVMISFFALICAISYYFAFVKKSSVDDDEQAEMINEMKGMFGGKK